MVKSSARPGSGWRRSPNRSRPERRAHQGAQDAICARTCNLPLDHWAQDIPVPWRSATSTSGNRRIAARCRLRGGDRVSGEAHHLRLLRNCRAGAPPVPQHGRRRRQRPAARRVPGDPRVNAFKSRSPSATTWPRSSTAGNATHTRCVQPGGEDVLITGAGRSHHGRGHRRHVGARHSSSRT